jgi:autotransporter-associated beta strand protein
MKLKLQNRLALMALTMAGITSAGAQTNRYWDPSGSGSFGSIDGTTWTSPVNLYWTNAADGGSTRLGNFTTTLTDICNWGGPVATLGVGTRTVPVATVNAHSLSFNLISGNMTLSGGTITLASTTSINALTSSQTHTISSTLAGAATSLTKTGLGTIVLSGSNTYTGSTIISAGTLTLGNTNALVNSPLDTLASIAGTASSGLKATVTSLTFGGFSGDKDLASLFTTTSGGFGSVTGITLNPGNAVTTTYSGIVADGAAGMTLTKGGAGTQVLQGANTYTGATTVNAGKLTLDYSTQDNSKLSDTGALVLGNGTLELAGGTHTEVVASTTLTGNTFVTRSSGTAVLALGAISGSGSVDFSAANIATTTTPNNALGLLPFATIGGSDLAANDGSGNIVAYTGYSDIAARGPSTVPDNVNAIVRIFGDGTSGNISLAATTTTINSLLQSNASFAATIDTAGKALATTAVSVGSSAESLNIGAAAGDGVLQSAVAGGTLGLTGANLAKSLTINAVIADNSTPSGVSTGGAGTVVLAGTNTYTGATLVGDGSLQLSGSITGSAVSVAGDAVLDQTSTGIISGTVGLAHNSTATSILAGTNTYDGVTAVNSGVLNIRNNAALGATVADTTVASGAALQIQDGITVGAEALTLQGSGVAGTGALRNISGANTYGGLLTLAGSTVINSDAGTLTLSGPGAITGATFALTVGGAGDTVVNGIIDTIGILTKQGAGTLTLTGANTYTSAVSVAAGVLNLQNSAATGTTAGGVAVVSGAALQLQGGIAVGEPLNLIGTGVSNDGALRNISGDNTWGGLISISVASRFQSDAGTLILDVPSGNAIAGIGVAGSGTNNAPMTFGGAGNITVADPISSGTTGNGTLTKEGTGTLTLQGTNIYSGRTVVAGGLISVENALALQRSPLDTTTSVAGDATNGLKTNTTALTIGGLIGDKNLADVFTTTSGGYGSVAALTLNPALARSYSGIIADGAAGMTLTKSGAGVQTISGALNHTGATSITGGTLKLDGSASIAASPSITLGSGTGLDVSTLITPLSLGASQVLGSSGTGANATATVTTALGVDLTLSAGGLVFSGYGGANGVNATNAPLTVTGGGAGELKLNGAPVTVTTTALLAPGNYVLVAKGGSALVTGTPGALTVSGSGVDGTPSLAVTGDQLVMTVTATGYSLWKITNGTTGGINLDHDGDGVANGIEYFIGGPSGVTTGFTAVPTVVDSGGTLSITWPKGAGYVGTYGTDFEVETSATLSGPWTPEPLGGGNIVDTPDPGGSVKFTFPGGPTYTGKNFARLKVNGP